MSKIAATGTRNLVELIEDHALESVPADQRKSGWALAWSTTGIVTTLIQLLSGQLLISSAGLVAAILLNVLTANVYATLFGIAIFGGIVVWIMVFVTFLRFRPQWQNATLAFRAPLYPYLPIGGAVLLSAILLTMLFNPDWRFAWEAGVPFFIVLVAAYVLYDAVQKDKKREGKRNVRS